jgi:CCR4-NOT transcriptional regulation complex NOT5 subunit
MSDASCRTWFSEEYQALTIYVSRISTRHIQRQMCKLSKTNTLLYIKYSYNKTYIYYKAQRKLYLIFSLGLHTPQGRLTRRALA